MTAGTDSPDPGDSSNAARMPSVVQIRHMPYLDHNYGQPPPMTPPDSCSPAPEDGDTGNEDDEEEGITRCICGFNHDDGYMICCDKCSVWQHIECMGISSATVPENYLCDQCDPRPLDKFHAQAIQARKSREISDDDEDDDESEEEGDGTMYTAVSNTPTRITLTAKVSRPKRKRTVGKSKGHKEKNKKTKRRKRTKERLPPELVPVDEDTNMAWENNSRNDNYDVANENIYSKELEELALSLNAHEEDSNMVPQGNLQFVEVVEVQKNTKGIVTTEDLDKNQFLIKCKGRMMLGTSFDAENPFFKRHSPYVLYYGKLDHLQLCVDARTFGNDARFVRRSCSPTAEVRHYISKGKLCLALFSLFPLPKGSEVTIPFEHSYNEYKAHLTCACSQDTCAVTKFNLRCQQQNHSGKDESPISQVPLPDDSSNSGHHNSKLSPIRMALPGHNSFHGDSDSDIENNPDTSMESESRRRKLSREERKLEAYVKQIEKMEKKEKKRQQPSKEPHKQIIRTPSDEGKVLQKSMRGSKRLNHKRRSNGGSAMKKTKRARVSSCSSEPLSPEEVSSSASTPTTPKMVATIPEEPQLETPATSPNRNFRFPKMKMDEDSQESHPLKLIIKTEAVESNVISCPSSPCSPRESEAETKPTLSTASSNSDIAMEVEMEEADGGGVEDMCDSSVDEQGFTSLAGRLAEISSVASNESNTPSPCPSTSASPTCSESVMNGHPPVLSARSPGPAPGSPLAAVLHGPRANRSNPLYCSLKKRWLCQFLYGYNLPDTKPPNGLKHHIRAVPSTIQPVSPLENRKTCVRLQKEPLPLKKRHLKSFQESQPEPEKCSPLSTSSSSSSSSTSTINHTSQTIEIDTTQYKEPLIISTSTVTGVNPASLVANMIPDDIRKAPAVLESDKGQPSLHLSSGEISTSSQLLLGTYSRHFDSRISDHSRTLDQLQVDVSSRPYGVTSTVEHLPEKVSPRVPVPVSEFHSPRDKPASEYQPLSISANPVRRVSDPRLAGPGAYSSSTPGFTVASVITCTGGMPSTLSSPSAHHPLTVITSPVSATCAISSTDMQGSTPGKKKVSLLEYRNRSRQRLSGDSPKTSAASSLTSSHPSPSAPPPVTTAAMHSASSGSLPNLAYPMRTPASIRRMSTGTLDTKNGPCFEPVSPDEEGKNQSGLSKPSGDAPSSQDNSKPSSLSSLDPNLRKKLVQKNKAEIFSRKQEGIMRLDQKLSAIISEQLTKDTKGSPGSNHSPSRGSNSPCIPPPPPPPPQPAGDAMEIEDDDSQSGPRIFVNTPVVSSRSAPVPPQMVTEYINLPLSKVSEYRPSLSHHSPTQASLLAPLVSLPPQLQGQISSQSQPRITQAPYLVTSGAISATHMVYPSSYPTPSPQGTSYYQP